MVRINKIILTFLFNKLLKLIYEFAEDIEKLALKPKGADITIEKDEYLVRISSSSGFISKFIWIYDDAYTYISKKKGLNFAETIRESSIYMEE